MQKLILLFAVLLNTLFAVDSFSTQAGLEGTKANLYNGAISEHISTTIYKKNGYTQIDAEVGRHGVDGLFVKMKDGTQDVIFSEVKHGNGKLGWIKNPQDPTRKIKQMSSEWQVIKIDKKIKNLEKIGGSKEQIEQLEKIRTMVQIDKKIENLKKTGGSEEQIKQLIKTRPKGQVKSQITRVTNMGDNTYTISFDELQPDGKLGKQLKHKMNDTIIDLNKQYKVGSSDWKLQKTISHSVRKEKKLLKEGKKLKALLKDQKKYVKDSKRFVEYSRKIDKQKGFIKQINKSRPKIFGVKTKTLKNVDMRDTKKLAKKLGAVPVPSVMKKVGNRVLVFMDAGVLKKSSSLKKMKFMKNVKGGDVVMMVLEGGVAVYSVMQGGMSFKHLSKMLLKDASKELGEVVFTKGVSLLIAPPVGTVIIIAGALLIDYGIDKYVELEKRGYVGLEDMLWNVPDEIKNKITVLNLEDTKRETVFDFGDIDKETILDEEVSGESVFDEEDTNEKETILDY